MSEQAPAVVAPEARLSAGFRLSSGRVVKLDVPVPLSPMETLEFIAMLPGGIAQLNGTAITAAGGIALPDGTVMPVARRS